MCEIIVCSGGSISNGRSTEIVMDVADYIAYFLGLDIDFQIETCCIYQSDGAWLETTCKNTVKPWFKRKIDGALSFS